MKHRKNTLTDMLHRIIIVIVFTLDFWQAFFWCDKEWNCEWMKEREGEEISYLLPLLPSFWDYHHLSFHSLFLLLHKNISLCHDERKSSPLIQECYNTICERENCHHHNSICCKTGNFAILLHKISFAFIVLHPLPLFPSLLIFIQIRNKNDWAREEKCWMEVKVNGNKYRILWLLQNGSLFVVVVLWCHWLIFLLLLLLYKCHCQWDG